MVILAFLQYSTDNHIGSFCPNDSFSRCLVNQRSRPSRIAIKHCYGNIGIPGKTVDNIHIFRHAVFTFVKQISFHAVITGINRIIGRCDGLAQIAQSIEGFRLHTVLQRIHGV